ncbi:hypothetical protein RV15_GL002436 [Enterococcus silesiacus]|nr:hypothetical protein RV15_GL002436 [Enterococcus silesiacus]
MYKRIYIDLPGMGKSPAPSNPVNANGLLNNLLKFIDAVIGKETFSVLGYSYGGYLALGIVKLISERIKKLVLLAPVIKTASEQRKLPKIIERKVEIFEVEEESLFKQYKASAVNVTKNGYEHYIREISSGLSVGDRVFQKTFQKTGYAFDFEKSLFVNPIVCDSLILLGKQDVVVGYEDTLEHQHQFLNSEFILIENAGHNLQLDERQKVIAEIQHFFS